MTYLLASLSGLIMGCGLILSGMTDPGKVQAFLDVAGAWDPSLAFVMAGAIGVASIVFRLSSRLPNGLLHGRPPTLASGAIDTPLIVGSLLFGVGWGISGICPGPALVGIGAGYLPSTVFVICLLFGMEFHAWLSGSPVSGTEETSPTPWPGKP